MVSFKLAACACGLLKLMWRDGPRLLQIYSYSRGTFGVYDSFMIPSYTSCRFTSTLLVVVEVHILYSGLLGALKHILFRILKPFRTPWLGTGGPGKGPEASLEVELGAVLPRFLPALRARGTSPGQLSRTAGFLEVGHCPHPIVPYCNGNCTRP